MTFHLNYIPFAFSLLLLHKTHSFAPLPLHNLHKQPDKSPLPPRLTTITDIDSITSSDSIREYNFTATFPPYTTTLSYLSPGECISSDPYSVFINDEEHKWCLLLYPRGQSNSPLKKSIRETVDVYLRYHPPTPDSSVDATFRMLLKGKQTKQPKFDLEWSAGMRFVSSDRQNLKRGVANDFGSSLMQSNLLPFFLGVEEDDDEEMRDEGILDVNVNLKLHAVRTIDDINREEESLFDRIVPRDIRFPKPPPTDSSSSSSKQQTPSTKHNAERVRVGTIIVPVLRNISQRPQMFRDGVYPGVEYRIMRILHPSTGTELFGSMPNADYELRPIYPLVPKLERQWPVTVSERRIPTLLTSSMYNFVSAVGSLVTAVTGLGLAFVISLGVSFYFIPSKSMDPTLSVGDVLLVEKITPRLKTFDWERGDIVLFPVPSRIQNIIAAGGGKPIDNRDLFVKRIAAREGDVVEVDSSGRVEINGKAAPGRRDLCEEEPLHLMERFIVRGEMTVPPKSVFLMGDCSGVSVDSRVWGSLPMEKIVGRPVLRVWPPNRFGMIPPLPPLKDAT